MHIVLSTKLTIARLQFMQIVLMCSLGSISDNIATGKISTGCQHNLVKKISKGPILKVELDVYNR